MHGQLSFGAPPQPEMPEEPEMSGQQMPEEQTDFNLTGPGSDLMPQQQEGMDYMYSRAELNRQIKEQETQIKELEINLKSAELKLAAAQKQKMDGRVLAEIDGGVKKMDRRDKAAVDKVSAALILQTWLDREKTTT